MADFNNGQSLEEILLAEERDIENGPDESPTTRDVSAFSGFGSAGVAPAKINGQNYEDLD